jgi:hypothetical protein
LWGVTIYMCEKSTTRFQYSAWNNSGKNAYWRLYLSDYYIEGSSMYNNRVEIQGTTASGTRDNETLWVWLDREGARSTNNVRDFSRRSLPNCA